MLHIPLWPPRLPAPCHSILPSSLPDHPSAAGSTRPDPNPTTPLTILTSPSRLVNWVQVSQHLDFVVLFFLLLYTLSSLHVILYLFLTHTCTLFLTHPPSLSLAFKFSPLAVPLRGKLAKRDEGLESVRSPFSSPNSVHTEFLPLPLSKALSEAVWCLLAMDTLENRCSAPRTECVL